jgi:hypothetical protein
MGIIEEGDEVMQQGKKNEDAAADLSRIAAARRIDRGRRLSRILIAAFLVGRVRLGRSGCGAPSPADPPSGKPVSALRASIPSRKMFHTQMAGNAWLRRQTVIRHGSAIEGGPAAATTHRGASKGPVPAGHDVGGVHFHLGSAGRYLRSDGRDRAAGHPSLLLPKFCQNR